MWVVAILVVLAAGGYGVMAALRPSRTIDPSKLATVERGDLARVVVATGKIQPLSKAEIKSKASGIVKKIYVDYGDRVKTGQILAELDKIQLEAAQRAAKANLQAAEAARNSSMAALERYKVDAEGPDVPFLKLSMERAEHELQRRRGVEVGGGRCPEELPHGGRINKPARKRRWRWRARTSPRRRPR